uniref:Uncharacterized protein n=1 Tax=Sphaerodactylus townsendi TaxID=933632 RepID=A0ACB8GA20_9SAUR
MPSDQLEVGLVNSDQLQVNGQQAWLAWKCSVSFFKQLCPDGAPVEPPMGNWWPNEVAGAPSQGMEPPSGREGAPSRELLGSEPYNPGKADKELDTLASDLHCPYWDFGHSAQVVVGVESPFQLPPFSHDYWRVKPKGQHKSTWLMQPMDQDICLEWDLEEQEWSRAQVQVGTWAPEQGADVWWQEQDEICQELYFTVKMEPLLARTKADQGEQWLLHPAQLGEALPAQLPPVHHKGMD